jgi:membrane protein YdbS with pleckstrin-like domain
VPDQPPALPLEPGERMEVFQPANGFLRYLKFKFWIGLAVFDGAIFLAWLVMTAAVPWLGVLFALPALVVAVLPDVVVYVAIHLQYDTTWYVMTHRSLRIRRGIWAIHETTITFENVQNVEVNQGPLERIFGIADVHVDTAGGGGKMHGDNTGGGNAHRGLIQGVDNAEAIRDLIMHRLRHSRTTGLGDERTDTAKSDGLGAAHIARLREIRDVLHQWAARVT